MATLKVTPPFNHRKPSEPSRNFGELKTRSLTLQKVQARIIKSDSPDTLHSISFENLDHETLIKIVHGHKPELQRALSRYFFKNNGIYARAVRLLADMNKFDFLLYPNIDLDDEIKDGDADKIVTRFNNILEYFDKTPIQLLCRKWAIQICLDGAYYGYICPDVKDSFVVQDLPINYCRSRYNIKGLPIVEFNVKYFFDAAPTDEERDKLCNLFPSEFQEGYRKWKANLLPPEYLGDTSGWITLDINRAFKFNFYGDFSDDRPPLLNVIPALIELEEIQDLEKEKLLQQIQKILVQTFSLDKNGQLPFSMPELKQLNQNAIDMVGDAVGISVLTTMADVHLENVDSSNSQANASSNSIEAAEKAAYNAMGISENLFNTSGNLALEKSILVDEAYVKPLILQFEAFFNRYIDYTFNKTTLKFRMKMLYTTIFNYEELSKRYESLVKIGFSRFLPMAALGHTQKEITSMAKLEQQIMQLDAYMLPPFSSNTMSSETWADIKEQQSAIIAGKKVGEAVNNSPSEITEGSTEQGGRPELSADQKSDKTLANAASAN